MKQSMAEINIETHTQAMITECIISHLGHKF